MVVADLNCITNPLSLKQRAHMVLYGGATGFFILDLDFVLLTFTVD